MPEKQKKILILAADMYEDMELWYPKIRVKEAGYQPVVAGKDKKTYQGKKGYPDADLSIDDVKTEDYAALIVPGGYAPDLMRRYDRLLQIVREFHKAANPSRPSATRLGC